MKFRFNYSYLFIVFSFVSFLINAHWFSRKSTQQKKVPEKKLQKRKKLAAMPQVRVLLREHATHKNETWLFFSQEGFWITVGGKKKIRMRYPDQWLSVRYKNGTCVLGRTVILSDVAIIAPYKKKIQFNDVTYHGIFELRKMDKKIVCVNSLPLEQYVRSVLRSEGWPGWPLEVYKSFAIMCRTYVISMIDQSRKKQKKCIYHIKNTNEHQTYTGRHKSDVIKRAVAQTEGVVIGFEGKPILAMFDSCCGGIKTQHIEGVDFKKAPYLARKKVCKYCKKFPIYSWSAEYTNQEFEHLFKKRGYDLGTIRRIKITKKDKAGLIHELQITGKKQTITLSGQQFYSYIPDVKSFCFTLKHGRKGVSVSGRGYGHHVGLCQWGARKMIDKGYTYKKILAFYYPGTSLMNLA